MLQLRIERQRRGWSLTRVSGLTGIAASDLSAVERETRIPFGGWRRRIAKAFGVPEHELFVPAEAGSERERRSWPGPVRMNPHLAFLLGRVYDATRLDHPAHLADLRKSGLTDQTIRVQEITDVPPNMLAGLLGFDPPHVVSAYLLPFPDPRGEWMDHVRVRVFPTVTTNRGTIKYLQPRGSGVRIFFPLAALDAVFHDNRALWVVEGEKKALAVAQLGLAAVGICGIEGWHVGRARRLLDDFDAVPLDGRLVEIVPDGDVATNPHVARAARRFADALRAAGARPRLVRLPQEVAA
jgi:transcriptional regulator with XRE-family HTH domain